MTFVQPLLLYALPLMALPILIHLINQRRHRTIEWGAMQFLLSAKKMSKGMARLRHILIMTARVLAIATLLFAICRPLATGWLGALAGGKPETVIILLDRSASMKQQNVQTGQTKITDGIEKIASMLKAFDGTKQVVLIESTTNQPIILESTNDLLNLPEATGTDASADIPAMLDRALKFVRDTQTGRTDIWVCSDARENDWKSESTEWAGIVNGFQELEGVRFHVLNYSNIPTENLSVSVDKVEQFQSKDKTEIILDVRIRRSPDMRDRQKVNLKFTVGNVPTVVPVVIEHSEFLLSGHRIVIDKGTKLGWGKVEIPTDSNESDNAFYFSFADPPVYKTVIVSENPKYVDAMKIAASSAFGGMQKVETTVLDPTEINELDWEQTALLLWHAPLPTDTIAKQVNNFINAGRIVLFFPSATPSDIEFAGASWGNWEKVKEENGIGIQNLGVNDDILQKTLNGKKLKDDDIRVYEYCSIKAQHQTLATLMGKENISLLTRAYTDVGGAYFCTTLPEKTHSSFWLNGIVMYAIVQRALTKGASSIGAAKMLTAGTSLAQRAKELKAKSELNQAVYSDSFPYVSGVYGDDKQIVALNRPLIEEISSTLDEKKIEGLFQGLDVNVIKDELGSKKSLASEIWRIFIAVMGLMLVAEVILCLPPRPEPAATAAVAPPATEGVAA